MLRDTTSRGLCVRVWPPPICFKLSLSLSLSLVFVGCAFLLFSLGPTGDCSSSPHRAKQRLSAGRARDHPVMEIVPNKALSLSLSLV